MIDRHRVTLFVALASLVAVACGGSGSTGLILPEAGILDEVRRDGTCITSGTTTFCATNSPEATTPTGARAVGGELFDGLPGPCPVGGVDACGNQPAAFFDVRGFAPGAACGVAARPAGSESAWSTGQLIGVGETSGRVAFPLPPGLATDLEVVLLCFESPPPALRVNLDLLVDSGADVIFVPDPE